MRWPTTRSAASREYAIERLLNCGYFYKVEGNLRVTEPETGEE